MFQPNKVAIIGAGPAGLMAAETLAVQNVKVDLYDAMPSVGRKFLMAGKSGLNITHSEEKTLFLSRYNKNETLKSIVSDFDAQAVTQWMSKLGIETFTGTTGRVFPKMMKASPLLRAWLKRLADNGVTLYTKHKWQGWDEKDQLIFDTPNGPLATSPDATVLALGGASWKRLGSNGNWTDQLNSQNIETTPFEPSNSGFYINWSDRIKNDFAGAPIKSISAGIGQDLIPGEFVITQHGVESGVIYPLAPKIKQQLKNYDTATLTLDLLPNISEVDLVSKLERPRGKQSLSNHLRKTTKLSGAKLALLYEGIDKSILQDMPKLAMRIKSLPIIITDTAPLDEAISTTGGVPWNALDEHLMLKEKPGTFCAGEMIDWDAPTGGYLITACMATGKAAANGVKHWLDHRQ